MVRVRDFRRSGMRLSAASAESWCLDNIVIPAASSAGRPAALGAPGNPQRGIQGTAGRELRHQSGHPDRNLQPPIAPAAGSLVGGIGAVPIGRPEATTMNRLRNRLILVFVVATLAPLCLMGWISVRLLHYSLSLSSTPELDQVSQSLKRTGHELFRQASDSLKQDAASGRIRPHEVPDWRQEPMADCHPGILLERRCGKLQSGRQPARPAGLSGAPRRRRRDVFDVSQWHRHAAALRPIHRRASHGCRGGHAQLAARIHLHLPAAGRRHLAADISRAALLRQAHQPAHPGIDQGTVGSSGRPHGLSRTGRPPVKR